MSSTSLKRVSEDAYQAREVETPDIRGPEVVTPEVHSRCVIDCMFAPNTKQATVAWFNGFFDEINCKPHRYDFKTPKGIPEYYQLGYEFGYVYSQVIDGRAHIGEVTDVQ